MEIKINTVGRIAEGVETGKFIKILDDSSSTGGFLVLTSEDLEMKSGHDIWVENLECLNGLFREVKWIINWL